MRVEVVVWRVWLLAGWREEVTRATDAEMVDHWARSGTYEWRGSAPVGDEGSGDG